MTISTWNEFCPMIFGAGAAGKVGEHAKRLGMSKVLVCTERILHQFGVTSPVIDSLTDAGVAVALFDECVPDAPSDICDKGAAFARTNGIDGVVAVGGGSTLDTAKAIGVILSQNGSSIRDYFDLGPEDRAKHSIGLITLTTTSGTGSEISVWAIIKDVVTGAKRSPYYEPDFAVIDPELTYSLPAGPTIASGVDALAHCIEGITNRHYNPFAYVVAQQGIRLALKWLPVAAREPHNVEARENMSLAANFGGMIINSCGCQIGHSFSQTFAARNHIAHGIGCAWGLPGVITYTAKYGERKDLQDVADAMSIVYSQTTTPQELADSINVVIIKLLAELGIKSIKDSGFTLDDCLEVADQFPADGAFGNTPGNPGSKEIREYIEYTYNVY